MSKFTETLLDDHFPDLLPSQRAKIIALKGQLWDDMVGGGDGKLQMPFCHDFFQTPEGAKLVRKVPNASEVQAAREATWLADHEETRVPPGVRIEISRSLAGMSDEAKLAAVADLSVDPKSGATITPATGEVAKLDAKASAAKKTEDENDDFIRRMGYDPYQILPSKYRELIAARDALSQSQGLRRDALRVDELNFKSGGDNDKLTAVERMTLARSQASLKAG